MEERRYKQMILKLGRLIKADELSTLKYLCKDVIPTKYREKITTTEALFEALEERGKVSPGDLTFLKQLLQDGFTGRTDVQALVKEYEQGVVNSPDVDSVRFQGPQTQGFIREIQYLEDNLGREYKSFLRRLGVGDHDIERIEIEHPKNVKEVIHQCICVWLQDHKHFQHAQLVKFVVEALKKEKRNDLAKNFDVGILE